MRLLLASADRRKAVREKRVPPREALRSLDGSGRALTPSGLPAGVQLVGRRGEERTLIALAQLLEEALGGWIDPDETRPEQPESISQ